MKRSRIVTTAPLGTVLLLVFTTLSCSGNKPIKTMTLLPVAFDTFGFLKNGSADFSCFPFVCVSPWGTYPLTIDPATQIQVGFDYKLDNGTAPCNCWWYKDFVRRGAVRFDLGALLGKNVFGATLQWNSDGPCVTKAYIPDKDWGTFGLSTKNEINPNGSSPGQVEVGPTVRAWLDGTQPNHGWMFAGDESFPNHAWKEGDAEIGPPNTGTSKCMSVMQVLKCASVVQGMKLVVSYTD